VNERAIRSAAILAMAALAYFSGPISGSAQVPEANPYDDPNQPPPRPPAPPPEAAPVVDASESSETMESDEDASASTGTGQAPQARELDVLGAVVASAGVAGELATPVCEAERSLEPMAAAMSLESLYRRRQEGALILDTGGLLARHGLVRFAARENPAALARMVVGLGYHALAFGESDLGDPPAVVRARLRALKDADVPVLASNLTCDEAHAELCELLVTHEDGVPSEILEDADGERTRVAVFSFLEPEVAGRVGPDRMEGLTIHPLTESIRLSVKAARERGVNTVVAIIDSGRGAAAAARALAAVAELADDEKPDVILSADAGSELLFARPASFRPAVVAPPPRGATDVRLRRNRLSGTFDILARPVSAAETAAGGVAELIEAVGPAFCAELGALLPGGHFSLQDDEGAAVPMDVAGLTELAAGVMRETADADVAVLNRAAFDPRWTPTNTQGLTRSDVQIGVQYDEPLVVAEVSAYWLRQFARSNPGERALLALGLEISNAYSSIEKVKVNGRVLDDTARYRVVTVRFLAEGGDGASLTGADGLEWEPLEDVTLRSALETFLGEEVPDEDPRERVVDPWEVLEWTGRVNVDANFTGSAVRDPNSYAEGPLTNSSQAAFGLNGQLALNALSRYASWENTAVATYSLASTEGSDGLQEGSDLITYSTAGVYRRFRAENDELYVPDLLVEGLVRTEFTRADERDHRFMNLRFVGGLQWRLHLKVQARLVGGLEVIETLDPDLRSARPGFGAQLNIGPWLVMKSGLRKLTLTGNVDWFYTSPGGRNRHLLQALFDMQLDLTAAFALTLNVTLYGLSDTVAATDTMPEQDGDFAFALQTTAGLRVAWTERWLAY